MPEALAGSRWRVLAVLLHFTWTDCFDGLDPLLAAVRNEATKFGNSQDGPENWRCTKKMSKNVEILALSDDC